MERFVKGDVVVLKFPFSNLNQYKKRPALILTNMHGDDIIVSQITSVIRIDPYSLSLENKDFKEGSLHLNSVIRTNKLFTIDKSLILYKIGSLNENKIRRVEQVLINIFIGG